MIISQLLVTPQAPAKLFARYADESQSSVDCGRLEGKCVVYGLQREHGVARVVGVSAGRYWVAIVCRVAGLCGRTAFTAVVAEGLSRRK